MVTARFDPNPRQREAIEHVTGPLLVLAGAGTGKTTVLVERIARLIEAGHARADEILAITFTENAARELQERVERRLNRKAPIGTGNFHSYCLGILRRCKRDFSLLLPEDVYVFLRQNIADLGLERFIKPSDVGQFLHDLKDFFDRCNEELISPERFSEYVSTLRPGALVPRNCRSKELDRLGEEEIIARWQEIARVYTNSLRLLEEQNLGTFGMMISRAIGLLQEDAALLAEERALARFILIDEFQDCNSSNIRLAELLGGTEQNIFAVGDPDQAIYRFRGASSAAFEDFQHRFPATRAVILDENQRSRGNILRVAYSAIRHNPPVRPISAHIRFERKALESGRDRREQEQGRLIFDDPVGVVMSSSDPHEAVDIAEEIARLQQSKPAKERLTLAVLYRTHLHREKVIEELARREIPYIVRGIGVLETPVARDYMAVIRATMNDNDADSVFRVCALPQFEISPDEFRAKLAVAGRDKTFKSVLQAFPSGKRVLTALREAREFIKTQKLSAAGAFEYLALEFKFPKGDPAVKALLRFVNEWEQKAFVRDRTLTAFLEYMDLFQEGGGVIPLHSEAEMLEEEEKNPDAVRLMTVHAAKGLEFNHVWLLRVISPGFPTTYKEPLFEFPPALRGSIVIGDSKEVNEQEERRLFYVAITRARDRLAIHSRFGRGKDRTPPGFLRPLLQDRGIAGAVSNRESRRPETTFPPARVERSPVSEWMLLPPAFPREELALSANSVESYSTCPLKFKLQRDWKIPGEAAVNMQYGSAIHTVLKQYYDPAPHAAVLSIEDAVAAFRTEFNKFVIDDPVQRELYEKQGEEQLRTMLSARSRGSFEVIAAETRFEFTIDRQKVVGRMDRLDRINGNVVRVVDYKTGAPKDRRFADESLQLSIYAMGARQMGFVPQELVLLNLQGNEEVVSDRTTADLEKAKYQIVQVAEGIAKGRFDPTPGRHCRWCDYSRLCPETEQRVFIPTKTLAAEEEKKAASRNP